MLLFELMFQRWYCWCWVCVLMVPAAVQDSHPNNTTTKQKTVSSNISQSLSEGRELPQDNQPLPSMPVELTADVIDEINAIRNRLGGGVASRLEGLISSPEKSPFPDNNDDWWKSLTKFQKSHDDRPLEKEFERQLKALASETRRAKQHVSAEDLNQNRRENHKDLFHQHLRIAARHLDSAAAELEEVSQYDVADELRRQAQQMRLKARSALLR